MLEARLFLSIFVALGVAFSISACNSQGEEKPASAASITVKLGKDDISSEVHYESDKTTVGLRSESGIGSVDISYNPGSQSSELILQLHLEGLENLRLQAADTIVEASVSSSNPHEIRQSTSTGNGGIVEINPTDPLWLDIRIVNNDACAQGEIPLEDGYFQAVVPAEIFSGETDPAEGYILSVSWIDFYR